MGDSPGDRRAAELVGLLAEPDRLRIVAALVLGHHRHNELVDATGLDARAVTTALDRLGAGGLIERADDGTIGVRETEFKAAAIAAAADRDSHHRDDFGGFAPEAAAILGNFVHQGRLEALPAARAKRRVVLDWVAGHFEPGQVYAEATLNELLASIHPDAAALRRYLVDEELMERRDGFYWRAGGTFDVDAGQV